MIYGMSGTEVSGSNPMSSAKARDLLIRIADGDRTAFEAFATEITPFVHSRVSRIVWDQGAAEDVTQAVMLKVWTGASRFNSDRGNAFAWLTTICRNTAIAIAGSSNATSESSAQPRRPQRSSMTTYLTKHWRQWSGATSERHWRRSTIRKETLFKWRTLRALPT